LVTALALGAQALICCKITAHCASKSSITNSVQEEVGLRGAEMIAQTIQPNVAIVTDVTHDTTTPMIDQKKEGAVKNGPSSRIAKAA
jgi:putative aminopeptidase FrvX